MCAVHIASFAREGAAARAVRKSNSVLLWDQFETGGVSFELRSAEDKVSFRESEFVCVCVCLCVCLCVCAEAERSVVYACKCVCVFPCVFEADLCHISILKFSGGERVQSSGCSVLHSQALHWSVRRCYKPRVTPGIQVTVNGRGLVTTVCNSGRALVLQSRVTPFVTTMYNLRQNNFLFFVCECCARSGSFPCCLKTSAGDRASSIRRSSCFLKSVFWVSRLVPRLQHWLVQYFV